MDGVQHVSRYGSVPQSAVNFRHYTGSHTKTYLFTYLSNYLTCHLSNYFLFSYSLSHIYLGIGVDGVQHVSRYRSVPQSAVNFRHYAGSHANTYLLIYLSNYLICHLSNYFLFTYPFSHVYLGICVDGVQHVSRYGSVPQAAVNLRHYTSRHAVSCQTAAIDLQKNQGVLCSGYSIMCLDRMIRSVVYNCNSHTTSEANKYCF